MLRFCPLGRLDALPPLPLQRRMVAAATSTLQLQPRRSYATGARSTAQEQRYYTEPLRAPKYGISTIVGRQRSKVGAANAATTASGVAPSPMAEEIAAGLGHRIGVVHPNTVTRCLDVNRSPREQLVCLITSHCRPVRYNGAGVPVDGSLLLLPWQEQLRLCTAILAALYITKTFFDLMRFELLYYGVWKVCYRNDDSLMKRLLYYGSTAMLGIGLLFSFSLNFFLSACLVGRREIAGQMVCNVFAYVIPRRTLQRLTNRRGC
ncbi:hypothetical protein MNV84_02700 [Leishmania braziliensis]|nr:hypothetical protein MNV84_02700 [Leishmania braziliensis]